MAAERDAFGFYFSAHPVDAQRHSACRARVRSFAELSDIPLAERRSSATMAGLIESTRWRTSAKGRRYLMATISDPSGQYEATSFDDEPSPISSAPPSRACGLMTVELDRRPGEEMPRVTVKRFQPLDNLAKRTRLHLLRITDQGLIPLVGRELANAKEATVQFAPFCRSAKTRKRSWSSAAITHSTPTSPPVSRASSAMAPSNSAHRIRRGSRCWPGHHAGLVDFLGDPRVESSSIRS